MEPPTRIAQIHRHCPRWLCGQCHGGEECGCVEVILPTESGNEQEKSNEFASVDR